jgi:hypothetical protein
MRRLTNVHMEKDGLRLPSGKYCWMDVALKECKKLYEGDECEDIVTDGSDDDMDEGEDMTPLSKKARH